jgi:hypothetical protein
MNLFHKTNFTNQTPYSVWKKTCGENNLKSGIQGNGFFHHEYASIHSSLYVQNLLANNKMTVIAHPP